MKSPASTDAFAGRVLLRNCIQKSWGNDIDRSRIRRAHACGSNWYVLDCLTDEALHRGVELIPRTPAMV